MHVNGAPIIRLIAAPEDAPRAAPVIARLTQRGFAVVSAWPVPSGPATPLLTLVAVAPASNRSPAVRGETERALTSEARVAPLLLMSRKELPSYLARLQWVDFSGPFESGWLDLLAALDRAGVTRYPPAPGWFDWEVALARAYRGLLPPDWRAYRATPTYYVELASNNLIGVLAGLPALLFGMGILQAGWLLPLLNLLPIHILTTQTFTILSAVIAVACLAYVTISPLRATSRATSLRDDRSEIVVISPDGFGMRTRESEIVFQFRDLVEVEQVPDPPRPSITRDTGPEAGFRLMLGSIAGSLRVRIANGEEKTISLGDRFPDRAPIAQQIVETFAASRARRAQPSDASRNARVAPIFISHARKDRVAVDRLDEVLRLASYQTWVDRGMLAGGEDWSHELDRAIAACAALVIVVSPASRDSAFVTKEYTTAMRLGKPVLAVLLRPTRNIAQEVQSRLCADVTAGLGAISWEKGWAPLLLALERAGVKTVSPESFNASQAIAHALADNKPPSIQVFKPTPLGREPSLYLAAILASPPLIALAWALALHANAWFVAGWVSLVMIVAWRGAYAFTLRYRRLWLLAITPTGAALLRADNLDGYPWADYDNFRVAPPRGDPGGARGGGVLLRLRATSRERRMVAVEVFSPLEQVASALSTSFLRYRAARLNKPGS